MSDKIKKFLKILGQYYLLFAGTLIGTKFIIMLNNKDTIKNTLTSEFFFSFIWAIPLLTIIVMIKVVVKNYIKK
ncbi:hypothetical protein [Carnobacterium inhibens]|uniref:hypothetical protein n=1 Tax=Carnobacterium inhibens TaxID=147709 RepID=UPI00055393F1|nr:hypothetical protein [Carnobacterium inhibens]